MKFLLFNLSKIDKRSLKFRAAKGESKLSPKQIDRIGRSLVRDCVQEAERSQSKPN